MSYRSLPAAALLLMSALSSLPASAQEAPQPGVNKHPLPESGAPYGYLSFIPQDYDAKRGKHPLVIFLHGLGELGDSSQELDKVAVHGPFKVIKKDASIFNEASCVVLAPQGLKSDGWWKPDKLEAFLEHALKSYAIDKDRVYLTGLSMGGGASWLLANKQPRTFAALVPICGASKPGKKLDIRNLPIWAFHSIGDKTVEFGNSEEWLQTITGKDKLMEAYPKEGVQSASFDGRQWAWSEGQQAPKDGKTPIGITVFPDNRHDSWTRAYADPKLWQWLFAQKR